jgi:hypothetical protein
VPVDSPAVRNAPAPAAIAEPLLPLRRAFVPVRFARTRRGIVHLPEGAPLPEEQASVPPLKLRAIHGRGPRDVWILTADAVVIHDDGQRVVGQYPKVCGWGDGNLEGGPFGTFLVNILADRNRVRVLGMSRDPWSRIGTDLTATLTPPGTWKCEARGLAPSFVSSSGDHTWKLADNNDDGACRLRALGGPCAPIPWWAPSYHEPSGDSVDAGVHFEHLFMRGLDDGWLVHSDESRRKWLLRYNGVAWAPVGQLDEGVRVVDLWADEEGHAWLVAQRDKQPENEVYRTDAQGLHPLPVPASFSASRVSGTGPRDVWFGGGGARTYQWDGARLREGAAPFEAIDMWSSPGGEVWLLGEREAARTAPLREAIP